MSSDATVPALITLVDLLTQRADQREDKLAFSFSRDGEEQENSHVTYRQLDTKARRIAAELLRQGAGGERVLVLCPPGIDFMAGFFGCLYAGAIAIPVHPPMRDHLVPRVESIIADVQPGFALTTVEIEPRIRPAIDGLPGGQALRWTIVDALTGGEENWVAPDIDGDSIAMLQYTSGSTSAPKGVVLTHGNLVHNLETICQAWGASTDMQATGVFWLPPYHDMGLIGGLLETLYVAGNSILMPPTAFIKRPMRWLEAISRHRAKITAAPNFAYDLCVELSTPEERAALDLSNWTAALCGAEPVRTATLHGFAEAFAPAGFRLGSFLPVYGLAEGTLLVSGGSDSPVPMVRSIDRVALRDNHIRDVDDRDANVATLVGCGRPRGGQRVVIVDPETELACPPDEVGEIWVKGGSVAHGYWQAPELSAETFAARIADTGEGPFLRTGDLGFLREGELFVTGRSKDLIIIRGRNHYPNDIELTVQNTNPALLPGRGAVFSVAPDPGEAEQLVVVQEVDPSRLNEAELADAMQVIRTAVTENHAVRTHAVILVQPLQLPTTSSGKMQRSATKQLYLDGALPVVAAWPSATPVGAEAHAEPEPAPAAPKRPAAAAAVKSGPDAAQIRDWLINRLAKELQMPVAEIDPAKPFAYYGLDSIHAVRLSTALEKVIGYELTPTIAYEYPSIDSLVDHLTGVPDAAAAEAEPQRPVSADEPIAIIGIGCRFPGADSPEAFWQLLAGGVDATGDVPSDRWDVDAFYNPDPTVPGTAVTRRGGFLDQVDRFDFQFWGISPRESAQMDPQQRLLLETTWEALEDAGQVPDELAGSRTGVFVGISTNDYGFLRLGQPALVDAYTGTGNALSIAANRLSYTFDFHGPSLAIDTACSSSLVAVDLACRSLRDGECSMALAGGVNVILSPALAINFSKARVMAPDGRCKTFDADADGYVRSEGAGVVVLKPLSQALADNDPVYAVIRGSATNSDGRTNGLIAPSGRAQQAVVEEAYRRAGLPPGAAQYIEAHGTGTSIGDAIEANALGAAMAEGRPPGSRCLVGSVKTNIGHTEAAAGVAGLIKVALALQHRQIPPSLNYTEPNPHIPFASMPLDVVQSLTPWPGGGRAVAGVSSFGFGGTNAHVVLVEAPQTRAATHDDAEPRAELLALSARSPEALSALVGEYEMAIFSAVAGQQLSDLCYTAGARRGHHDYRLAVVGDSPAALFESLAAYRQGESRTGLSAGHCVPGRSGQGVTFIFSGQGSQWHGMAQRLAEQEPVFADALAAADHALHPHLGHSILKELGRDADHTKLGDIGLLQPTIFAIQVALAALWRSWGVQPAAVVGHSLGEVAAAHVAGALSLEDAARVICARARMLRQVRGRGAMMVVEATMAEAEQLIAGREQIAVAASNSYRSTVLAGDREQLAEVMAELERREKFCRWIEVDVASHSPQMAGLSAGLRGSLVKLKPTAPAIPMYSTVTGELVGDRLLDADYWVDNLCSPVRFSPALRRLVESGSDTFIELSPHPILLTGAREDSENLGRTCTLLASMRRDDDGRATALGSLGALYTLGHPIDWAQIYPPDSHCVPAPHYPWQRVHSWLDAGTIAAPRTAGLAGGGWRGPIRSTTQPGAVLTEIDRPAGPLTVDQLTELAVSAAGVGFGPGERTVDELILDGDLPAVRTLQFVLTGAAGGPVSFECYGSVAEDADWSRLATGTLIPGAASVAPPVSTAADPRDRIYQLDWQPASIADGEAPGRTATGGSWLILSDGPVGETLRDSLEAQYQSCVLVESVIGLAEIERVSADSYRVDPSRPEHFQQLLRAAFGGDRPPCVGVLHLWNLLAAPATDTDCATLATATAVGSLSVVHLVQALSLAGWAEAPRLWLITRGAQPAGWEDGAGPLAVAQAPVWGLGRSIDHEHPELHTTCVDLSAGGGPEESRALFSEIWADNREVDVALRGHRRYVARLARYGEPAGPASGFVVHDDATYLVTGGLGAVGGAVAGWLVEQGARHLVLMGRGAPSETAEAMLGELRDAGAQVTIARGDVTKPDDVAATLATITGSMPPLRGVVHAAGTVDDAIIARLDEAKLRDVMDPKVQGAWNLHTLTADAELDFFVLFSSAASLLGSPGAANYGAANAFLDALAWDRRAAGRPALSVNFGPWVGLGMFTNSDLHRHFSHYGVEGMTAEQYLAALDVLLAGSATEAMVLDIDWARWRPGANRPLLTDLSTAAGGPGGEAPGDLFAAVQAAAPDERQRLLEGYLRDLVAGKLGLAPAGLDVAAPLNSLGVDSLITLELRIQVERELGIVVPVARLLDGPSVASLSGWLSAQLADSVRTGLDRMPVPGTDAPAADRQSASSEDMDLLAQVPELSDADVDALLQKMIAGDQ